MPDHSRDNISRNHANTAVASEGQIWDSMNPDQRAQLLGQSIVGEADNSNIKNSVYQKSEGREYSTTPYTSLPPALQFEVSNRLHEAGHFQETYGAIVYEVEGDDRFECKDCEETFTAEEDFRVHRKINHDDNGESETESQEGYFRSLEIDPDITKDNLEWARKTVRGESSRVEYPQNEPKGPVTDPPLPKGRREYDDNPNHYFYDNKLFKRGSRGGNYDQTGTALTEARALIQLEEKILDKYGWESTIEVEKDEASRQVFAGEIAKIVTVENLHPRTIKILDSVHRPFLVNTLSKLASETDRTNDTGGDIDPFPLEEPVLHQDYDPEHPHEHNAFDTNFGDKVAEEDTSDYEVDVPEYLKTGEPVQEIPEDKRAEEDNAKDRKKYYDLMREQIKEEGGVDAKGEAEEDEVETGWLDPDTGELVQERPKKGSYIDPEDTYGQGYRDNPAYKKEGEEEETDDAQYSMKSMKSNLDRTEDISGDLVKDIPPHQGFDYQKGGEQEGDKTCPTCGFYSADEQELHSHVQDHALDDLTTGEEDFPFEDREEETTVTAEPDLLQNVNTDVLQVESEEYNPEEEVDQKAEEARIIQRYTGYKSKAGESVGDILDGAINVPEERQTADETIYDRKLEGHHEDKIARELLIWHDIEYEDAIERIRSIEVSGNDITAKTLFGKKFSDCNEAEISQMKILGGEAKRSTGDKND